jgi:hypothetical protein
VDVYICIDVGDPVIKRGRLTGLTLSHFCACPKPGPGFPTPYVVVFVFGGFRLRREMIVCFVDIGGSLKKTFFFVRERHEDIIYCQKKKPNTFFLVTYQYYILTEQQLWLNASLQTNVKTSVSENK